MKKAYILTVILMTFKGTLFSQEILSIFTYGIPLSKYLRHEYYLDSTGNIRRAKK